MTLFSRIQGQGPHLIILHGVFGSGDNWGTFVRPLLASHTVHLLDQRNHGRSPHSTDATYPTLAQDVVDYMDGQGIASAAIVGHSMGGKVGLFTAWLHPSRVQRLAVIDIATRAYAPHHGAQIAGMRAVDPATLQSRAEADARMAVYINDAGVRQFLLKNLHRTEGGSFTWRHNLEGLVTAQMQIGQGLPTDAQINSPLLFVRGATSNYITPEDEQDIARQFPQAVVATVPGAGHWVQVEQPSALLALLTPFLG